MDITDILDSDQRILSHSKRVTEQGQSILTFDWGDGSPPFKGVLPEKLEASILVEWCTAVRTAYNARENSKATKANRPPAVVRGAPDTADPPAAIASGSRQPVPNDVAGVKAAMEAGIESALAELGRQREKIKSEVDRLNHEAAALATRLHDIDSMVQYYQGLREKL